MFVRSVQQADEAPNLGLTLSGKPRQKRAAIPELKAKMKELQVGHSLSWPLPEYWQPGMRFNVPYSYARKLKGTYSVRLATEHRLAIIIRVK